MANRIWTLPNSWILEGKVSSKQTQASKFLAFLCHSSAPSFLKCMYLQPTPRLAPRSRIIRFRTTSLLKESMETSETKIVFRENIVLKYFLKYLLINEGTSQGRSARIAGPLARRLRLRLRLPLLPQRILGENMNA